MASTTAPKRPDHSRLAGSLLCPSCGGDNFAERSSFKTASEPLLGAASSTVVVDLMNCKRCGTDFPTVRGRRRYTLVGREKLSALLSDLEEVTRRNSEVQGLVDTMARRSQGLSAEIERSKARAEISVMEARVAALEASTAGLEARRDRLARVLEVVASIAPR